MCATPSKPKGQPRSCEHVRARGRSAQMPASSLDAQRGASLLVVVMILIIVSILGVGGAQIALMSERGARSMALQLACIAELGLRQPSKTSPAAPAKMHS